MDDEGYRNKSIEFSTNNNTTTTTLSLHLSCLATSSSSSSEAIPINKERKNKNTATTLCCLTHLPWDDVEWCGWCVLAGTTVGAASRRWSCRWDVLLRSVRKFVAAKEVQHSVLLLTGSCSGTTFPEALINTQHPEWQDGRSSHKCQRRQGFSSADKNGLWLTSS